MNLKTYLFSTVWILLIGVIITACNQEDDFLNSKSYAPEGSGKIKQILSIDNPETTQALSVIAEYEYDEAGRISKITTPYYSDNDNNYPISYQLYFYNTNDLIDEIAEYTANVYAESGYQNLCNRIYTYNMNEDIEKEYIQYPAAETFEYIIYKYDHRKLITQTRYNQNDEIINQIHFEYDINGNLVKETMQDDTENVLFYTIHSYSGGLNNRSDVYNAEGTHIREIVKTYDEEQKIILWECNELEASSSSLSHVLKYEYY